MNDFLNETNCSVEEQRRETAKEVLENMGTILREMKTQVAMISDVVYRGDEINVKKEPDNERCATPPMVVIMREQRDTAEYLLKEIIKIREVLW